MNILVADDMEMIRSGIRAILEQMSSGDGISQPLKIVTVSNGTEAVHAMEQEPADVLITDIRMPDMDGIDLMERCRRLWPQTHVIVVSGYDDFKYAQKAIEYGARAYLLKPIDRSELFRAVRQAETEKRQRLSAGMARANVERSVNTLFLHVLQGEGDGAEVMAEMTERHPFLAEACSLILIGFPGRAESGRSQCDLFRQRLLSRLPGRSLLLGEGAELVLILPECMDGAALIDLETEGTAAALVHGAKGLTGLRQAYGQAKNIYVHRLLFPDKRLLTAADIDQLSTDFTIPHGEVERLVGMIGMCSEPELSRALMKLFERRRLAGYGIGYTLALCDTLYRRLRKLDKKLRSGAELGPIHLPLEFESMREYLLYVNDHILRMHRAAENLGPEHCSAPMDRAEAYIRANYMRPITLAVVSNQVSLNYTYFSDAFRKHTGKTFSEYLRDIRLDEAKRLLRREDIKVSEVARQVGYDSYKSFYRAFRDATGITPVEYRQRRPGGEN